MSVTYLNKHPPPPNQAMLRFQFFSSKTQLERQAFKLKNTILVLRSSWVNERYFTDVLLLLKALVLIRMHPNKCADCPWYFQRIKQGHSGSSWATTPRTRKRGHHSRTGKCFGGFSLKMITVTFFFKAWYA